MASNAFSQCRDLALPREPTDPQLQNSAAAASLMKAMGVTACQTFDSGQGILPHIELFGVHKSVGCEQIAVLVQSIDISQRAIQCTVSKVSQTSSVQVITSNHIILNITGHAVITCINVEQKIALKIATNTNFGSEIRTAMASDMAATMRSFAQSIQNTQKDSTATVEGNRSAEIFSTQLEQTAFQGSFEEIIQESIQSYQPTNTFIANIGDYAMIGLLNPPPNLLNAGCLTVTQDIIMQLNSTVIMDNILAHVFSTSAAADWASTWISDQTAVGTGATGLGPLLGIIIAIAAVVALGGLAIFLITKGGGNNTAMSATPETPGQRGVQIGAAMIIIGLILFIVSIIFFATGISDIAGGVMMACALILVGIGGYVLWRAKQVQKQAAERKAEQEKPKTEPQTKS